MEWRGFTERANVPKCQKVLTPNPARAHSLDLHHFIIEKRTHTSTRKQSRPTQPSPTAQLIAQSKSHNNQGASRQTSRLISDQHYIDIKSTSDKEKTRSHRRCKQGNAFPAKPSSSHTNNLIDRFSTTSMLRIRNHMRNLLHKD
ncbi:hypothetical protein [Pseudomonas oryzae]|uniref:hypothetical protein n=1 Tax=Pseudomonas oryzae TaxID=1392877 RepID=UPI00155F75B4|nr:hypothetical protein [Pseudomonas oryzae]